MRSRGTAVQRRVREHGCGEIACRHLGSVCGASSKATAIDDENGFAAEQGGARRWALLGRRPVSSLLYESDAGGNAAMVATDFDITATSSAVVSIARSSTSAASRAPRRRDGQCS